MVLKLDKSSVTVIVALDVPVNTKLTPAITSLTLLVARLIEPKPFTEITAFCAVVRILLFVEKPRSGLELKVNWFCSPVSPRNEIYQASVTP